jgi:DNA-binding transcriptional LysR family regulator
MLRAGIAELTAFIAIADERSFRAAAAILGVSPSALSHSMRGLEERLGVRLFNRTTRSVALTDAGEQLLRRARPAIADLEDAVNEIASAQNRPSGSIRISASESGAKLLVQQVLPDFLIAYPDIHIEFVIDTRLVDIVADGFDAGIRVFQDVPRDMVAIKFGPDIQFAAVGSPRYFEQYGQPSVPHDLLKHRCIRFRFDSGALYRWELAQRDKSASVDVEGPMTLGNVNVMIEAALAGIGIAWVPEYQVAEHIASGRLIRALSEWSPSFPGLCLYYPANRHPPTVLRLLCQAVREWIKKNPTITNLEN